jgi:ABC-type Fe3+/spermidine/putrescine transport system ATPase subunit
VPAWVPQVGQNVKVSVRPEVWSINKQAGENVFAGRVVERSYLGQRIEYFMETALGRQQVCEMNPQVILDEGAEVVLHARRDDVVVFEK